MPLYSLVPSFRPLLAPVPRLRLRTDTHTHTHTQTDRHRHTQDNYRNPQAHARRGLILLCIQYNTMPVLYRISRYFCVHYILAILASKIHIAKIGHSQQEENMRRIQSVGGVITSVTHWGKKSDVMLRVYT